MVSRPTRRAGALLAVSLAVSMGAAAGVLPATASASVRHVAKPTVGAASVVLNGVRTSKGAVSPGADKLSGTVYLFLRGGTRATAAAYSVDGKSPPDGISPGVAGVSSLRITPEAAVPKSIVASFDGERIVGRTWPAASNEVTVLELTY